MEVYSICADFANLLFDSIELRGQASRIAVLILERSTTGRLPSYRVRNVGDGMHVGIVGRR